MWRGMSSHALVSYKLVSAIGFEPTTSGLQDRPSTKLTLRRDCLALPEPYMTRLPVIPGCFYALYPNSARLEFTLDFNSTIKLQQHFKTLSFCPLPSHLSEDHLYESLRIFLLCDVGAECIHRVPY